MAVAGPVNALALAFAVMVNLALAALTKVAFAAPELANADWSKPQALAVALASLALANAEMSIVALLTRLAVASADVVAVALAN